MKITIEHEGRSVTIEDKDAVALPEVLELLQGALRGLGFVFDGTLDIYDDSKDSKELE